MRLAILGAVAALTAAAQDGRTIPLVQAVPLPYDQVSFQRGEKELARYHFSPSLLRPFVYPVVGPSGRTLTRMGHPGDPDTHSHHNSVWISLSKVNGVDFWSDRGGGHIRHRRVEHLEDGNDGALAISEADWLDRNEKPVMRERRTVAVKLLPRDEWMLVIALSLDAAAEPAVIDKGNFGPIGVRMNKWIGVHHGGGQIRNSDGAEGETAIFRKPARWVDYSGAVAPGVIEGLTLMDHPSNPRHPAPFHVREDGWMGAMLALDEPYTILPGKPLHLRYGLYVHGGRPTLDAIDEVWKKFATEPLRKPFGPPKTERECLHGDHRLYNVPHTFSNSNECVDFVRKHK